MSITRQFIGMWATVGGYLVAVLLLIVIQGLLDMWGLLSYQAGLVLFIVLHCALLALFFRQMWRVSNPLAYREAREQGQPAQARVLAVKRTGWRQRRGWGRWTHEHLLQVEVERPGQPPYQAGLVMFLQGDQQAPAVGDVLTVKVHPRHPAVVVPGSELLLG